ncbi:TPA: transcriptional regulator [Citrobacter sedlakii]
MKYETLQMKYLIQQKIQFDAGEGYLISDNGEMIQLTRTACLLLVTLLTEQGVISRNTLLEKVWDTQGQQGSYSSLNQYLSIIRRSFRQLGLVNIVITVPRKGYQLNPDISVTSVASEGRAENGAILAPGLKRVVNEPSEEQRFLLRAHKVTIKKHRLAQSNRFCWKYIYHNLIPSSSARCYVLSLFIILFSFSLLLMLYLQEHTKDNEIIYSKLPVSGCHVVALEEVRPSYVQEMSSDFMAVNKNLDLGCANNTQFFFYNHSRIKKKGLGKTLLTQCTSRGKNPVGYCENYYYENWI